MPQLNDVSYTAGKLIQWVDLSRAPRTPLLGTANVPHDTGVPHLVSDDQGYRIALRI
jgi:hypothetical protein